MNTINIIKEIAVISIAFAYSISLIINAIANYIIAKNTKKPPEPGRLSGSRKK